MHVEVITDKAARIKALVEEIAALDAAAAKIDQLKAAKAIELGALLIEVKAALPHGKFRAWLAQNFAGSSSSATRYMQCAALANVAPVQLFGYSQLVQLLPLGSDIPAFLRDNPTAAELSKRGLRDAIAQWRAKLPAAASVTVAAEITTAAIVPTPRLEQLSLFPLPPLPPARSFSYRLPRDIQGAAAQIPAPVSLIRCRADFANAGEGVVVVFAGLKDFAHFLAKATAMISLPVVIEFTDGNCARRRRCHLLFTGDDIPAFAREFSIFGTVTIPYRKH